MNIQEIATFLQSDIEPIAKDKLKYSVPTESSWIATVCRKNYLTPLAKLLSSLDPERYLVIGVLAGTMESVALQHFKLKRLKTIVACDIDLAAMNSKRDTGAHAYINICGTDYGNFQGEFVYIRADSMKTELFKRLGKFDLIFLDGCHAPAGIISDLNATLPLLNKGGTILVHDIDMADGKCVGVGYYDWLSKHPEVIHSEAHDPGFFNGMGIVQMK